VPTRSEEVQEGDAPGARRLVATARALQAQVARMRELVSGSEPEEQESLE
jgi:hypothetical protein